MKDVYVNEKIGLLTTYPFWLFSRSFWVFQMNQFSNQLIELIEWLNHFNCLQQYYKFIITTNLCHYLQNSVPTDDNMSYFANQLNFLQVLP